MFHLGSSQTLILAFSSGEKGSDQKQQEAQEEKES
jgi:hypothetical protein